MVSMSGKSGNVLELESGEGNVGQLTECRGGGESCHRKLSIACFKFGASLLFSGL